MHWRTVGKTVCQLVNNFKTAIQNDYKLENWDRTTSPSFLVYSHIVRKGTKIKDNVTPDKTHATDKALISKRKTRSSGLFQHSMSQIHPSELNFPSL